MHSAFLLQRTSCPFTAFAFQAVVNAAEMLDVCFQEPFRALEEGMSLVSRRKFINSRTLQCSIG
jgi:hypothetical protein